MEKRKHTRILSTNLLAYLCVDGNGIVVQQGMGKTLDVSEGGILLETHVPIDPRHMVHLDIGFRDEVATLVGRVTYSRTGETGRWESGIHFEEHSDTSHEMLCQFIASFNSLKA